MIDRKGHVDVMRKSGVLLPVSAIPSKYGIGAFSKEAYTFIDLLEKAGQAYWQILPLGPTGYGDSPYQSFSTFAGNPYYIDLESLIEEGWLTKEDCEQYDFGDDDAYVDYEKIYLARFKVLKKAFQNSHIEKDEAYLQFVKENEYWLKDYSLYMAVKNAFGGKSWSEWDEDIKLRRPAAMKKYAEEYAEEVAFYGSSSTCLLSSGLPSKSMRMGRRLTSLGIFPFMWPLTVRIPGRILNCSSWMRR